MQLDCCLVSNLLLEAAEDLWNERDQSIFEDLGSYSELLELLLHLAEVHVVVDLGELVEEHVHALVVGDVRRHQVLELLGCLLLGVYLCELLQRLQEVLLELRDVRAYERLTSRNGRRLGC